MDVQEKNRVLTKKISEKAAELEKLENKLKVRSANTGPGKRADSEHGNTVHLFNDFRAAF